MPDIVAHGKRPDVRACSLCHYPNGKGRQENAGVARLPVAYFIRFRLKRGQNLVLMLTLILLFAGLQGVRTMNSSIGSSGDFGL